jgi:hypothetical protein
MSTNRKFQDMLNEYLPNKLLSEELIKRDYILSNIEKDQSWKGGKVIVPFKAAGASSMKMGGLTAASDISQHKYVRGSINDYKELWGSMIFDHRDIMDHSGKITKDSFLKIFPDQLEDFLGFMKMNTSIMLGTGPHKAKATANGTVGGVLAVSHIDRFELDEKVVLKSDLEAAAAYYVIAINVNSDQLTVSATRGGAAADISAYLLADNTKVYIDNADTEYFTSIRDVLLSAANGGSATVHGQSKLAYPFLQAVNVNGASITASNILDKLLDAYTDVRKRAKGTAKTFLMSYKHFGSILKALENKSNGSANWSISVADKKASLYGWDEIVINTVKGALTIVGIQEWDDDVIAMLDMSTMVFRSNGMFQKRKNPEGDEYFEVRNTTGFQYIVDICLFGELEISKPGQNGIIYGISY